MKKLSIFVLLSLFVFNLPAQELTPSVRFPTIGKPCPYFLLQNVKNYTSSNFSLVDAHGKWLVIDCWNYHCTSCIKSMPYTDSLAHKFSGKILYMLVGYTGSQFGRHPDNNEIRSFYDTFKIRKNLRLPYSFDSVFFDRFDISACPYIIVVDPEGIVRGITYEINAQGLSQFLDGQLPQLPKAYRKHEPGSPYLKYNPEEKAMTN